MIALVFALEYESAALREPNRMCVSVWNLGLTGKRCLNVLEHHLKRSKPSLLVSAGFAGAIQPGFPVGALIIGENLSCSRALRTVRNVAGFTFGEIATVDSIAGTSREKRALGESSGAISVDCESKHIRNMCDLYGVPMLAVRSVSDTVDQDLPVPAEILISNATGKPDPFRLFKYVLSHPSSVSGLCDLIRNSRVAKKSLARGLSVIMPRLLKTSAN